MISFLKIYAQISLTIDKKSFLSIVDVPSLVLKRRVKTHACILIYLASEFCPNLATKSLITS